MLKIFQGSLQFSSSYSRIFHHWKHDSRFEVLKEQIFVVFAEFIQTTATHLPCAFNICIWNAKICALEILFSALIGFRKDVIFTIFCTSPSKYFILCNGWSKKYANTASGWSLSDKIQLEREDSHTIWKWYNSSIYLLLRC